MLTGRHALPVLNVAEHLSRTRLQGGDDGAVGGEATTVVRDKPDDVCQQQQR